MRAKIASRSCGRQGTAATRRASRGRELQRTNFASLDSRRQGEEPILPSSVGVCVCVTLASLSMRVLVCAIFKTFCAKSTEKI